MGSVGESNNLLGIKHDKVMEIKVSFSQIDKNIQEAVS